MAISIGLFEHRGALAKYAERMDVVEVRPSDRSLPKGKKLQAWRAEVGEQFVFSVVLPNESSTLELAPEKDEPLAYALGSAKLLGATWLVLATQSQLRPTAANRKRLERLAVHLRPTKLQVAWDARGLWEARERAELCLELGWTAVLDPEHDDVSTTGAAYIRARNVRPATATRIAETLADVDDAVCIVDTARAAALVRDAL